ncbi:hypothetical protein IWW36_001299 [Coemansia brasiliensis]|uniref:PI3K/PI4K catalytic domain-containing protein n=1 Tax=Coemansia brasiliensis TaxID=2650707 RepID=A0A9W8M1N1_9FUNG|nr:hypothetical protein IWW36_001299 [Coemansia brasiliensis]
MAMPIFDTLEKRSEAVRRRMVLHDDKPCHFLLHLLDIALSNDLLDHSRVLSCLYLSAAVLSYGLNASAGNKIWQALVNFGGMVVARYDLEDSMQSTAIEFAHIVVGQVHEMLPATQTAAIALVYLLCSKYTEEASFLVTTIISQCRHASIRLKQDVGQMVMHLVEKTVLAESISATRDLAGDWDPHVRTTWIQIASQSIAQTQSTISLRLPMAIKYLCDNMRLLPINYQTAGRCASALTLDDAKFIVKLVSESIGCLGYGLEQESICTIGAFYQSAGMGKLSDARVHQACLTVIASAARRIGSDNDPESNLKLTIAQLASIIKSYLAGLDQQAMASGGLFWALEMLFQLCIQDAGVNELQNDAELQLLLVDAAVRCSNLSVIVYICQVAMADCKSSNDGAVIRRLAGSIDWSAIDSVFCGNLGDAASIMACRCVEAANEASAELEQLAVTSINGSSASERLCGFDSDLFKAGFATKPIDELRFERNLVCNTDAGIQFQLPHLVDSCAVADLILSTSGVFAAQELVFSAYQPMHTQLPQVSSIAWSEMTRPQQLQAINICYTHGLASSQSALNALRHMDTGRLNDREMRSWVDLAIKASINVAYNNGCVDMSLLEQHALTSDYTRYCFAFKSPCDINKAGFGDRLHQAATERCCTRAKEALLYFSVSNADYSIDFISDLYLQVLNETPGRLQLTALGTFDAASQLIAQMSTAPTHSPALKADSLSACAVNQLAPFIPQLLAMLCFDPHSSENHGGNLASDSAFTILRLLIQCAPDIVAFYVVVAQKSLPESSKGGQQVARLVQMLDYEQTVQIQTFLHCVSRVATLPQEQLKWACNKAKHAYIKLLVAYKQRRLTESSVPAAINDVLQPVCQLLEKQYEPKGLSPAENEYTAVVTTLQLRKRLDRLRFSNNFGKQDIQSLQKHADAVWAEIVQVMATPSMLDVGYASPQLVEFSANIPIPVLTQPADPLYFSGVDRKMRIIGSKTRPKLLTLHFHTRDNSSVSEKYIFKGSEDLRIDESVMQVFVRLNRVLLQDNEPHKQPSPVSKLAVYNIVPTGAYGGLIQMVNDAPSLFSIYTQHAAMQKNKDQRLSQPIPGLRQTFTDHSVHELTKAKLPSSLPMSEWPQGVTESVYDSLCSTVPSNLLHRHVMRASPSAAHLVVGLQRLVRSIGMASAAGYLVGLGDRHLDNLLVNTTESQLVHIDFNVCYDFGGVSQIPEQVPYRLTRNLAFLCGSLQNKQQYFAYSSSFAQAFSAVMQLARMDKHVLVNALAYRMMFYPFMEWHWIEQQRLDTLEVTNASVVEDSLQGDSVVETIRQTGLCPPKAFWSNCQMQIDSVTEASYGWRLAYGAIQRMQARLEFTGSARPMEEPDKPQESYAQLQTKLLWNVATDKSKLSRMFAGWASWI